MRTKTSVWWPGVTSQIKQMVESCHDCAKEAVQRRSPLMPTLLPEYPWQVIGTDLFKLKGEHYLLVVDYFSRYPEISKMTSITSHSIITSMKSVFARHGIPEIVRSDNGPQIPICEGV